MVTVEVVSVRLIVMCSSSYGVVAAVDVVESAVVLVSLVSD